MTQQHPDSGFTLIEVLLVIVILGLLASVVVAASDGIIADAEDAGCASDRRMLYTAVEMYFAQNATELIPAASGTAGGYEQTLADSDVLRSTSELYDLTASGALVVPSGSPCTV